MSLSWGVAGLRPPDEKWAKMKAVWDSCKDAGMEIPDEVGKFFGYGPPDPSGIEVDLEENNAITDWSNDWATGYEIDISKLPDNITIIRFYIG